MTLSETQSKFLEYVYATKVDSSAEEWAEKNFRSNPVSAKTGLKTYRKNLIFGFCGALQETYRLCDFLLGDKNFKFLCREYIYEHPSRSSDVTDYGAYFPGFLVSRKEIRDFPFLPDIARLEWARERAFYSQDTFFSLIQTHYQICRDYLVFLERGAEALEENPFQRGVERILVSVDRGHPSITLINEEKAAQIALLLQGNISDPPPKIGRSDFRRRIRSAGSTI